MPICTICKSSIVSVNALRLHYKLHNDCNKNLHTDTIFVCSENDICCRNYEGWNAFRKHLINFHKCPLNVENDHVDKDEELVKKRKINKNKSNQHTLNENLGHLQYSEKQFDLNTVVYDNEIESSNVSFNNTLQSSKTNNSLSVKIENINDTLHKAVVLFCSKLYSNPNLPRNHVQEIIDMQKEFILKIFDCLKELNNFTFDMNEITEFNVNMIFENIMNCLNSLGTEHKRITYFKKNGFIVPQNKEIGYREEQKIINGKVVKVREPVYLQYISLKETLRLFFSLPGTLSTVLQYMDKLANEIEVITNFTQCYLWKNKVKSHFRNKRVIPLFIYYDDFEVNNPLGSHSGIQKLGAVYMSIPVIPPEFKSLIENIFLVMLFHSADRIEFKNDKIFRFLVEEINELQENGISLNAYDDSCQLIYFSLGLIMADNLGINSAFSFAESFQAKFFCKLCKTPLEQTQTDTTERKENLRKVYEYDDDVSLGIKGSGVKDRSIWNKVNYFHVYNNIYVDPFHDLNEGVLKYDMGHLLYYYIFVAKVLTIEILNDRINCFNYSINSISNKPPPFTLEEIKNRKFRLSGSEMLNFTLIFPFLVGDMIDKNDDYWTFYLTLRQIIDIVFARILQLDSIIILNELVKDHHSLYLKLFKDPLKRKHHYFTHYGTVLRMSGPHVNLSTIRFESKHKFFTDCAHSTSSRKNITYTLALKEQLRLIYRFFEGKGFTSKFKAGSSVLINNNSFECKPYHNYLQNLQANIHMSFSVEINGIMYKSGMFLLLKYQEKNSLPIFGIVNHIFYTEKKQIYFGGKNYYVKYFDDKMHAYNVKMSNNYYFVNIGDLKSPFPLIYQMMPTGEEYVMLRNAF